MKPKPAIISQKNNEVTSVKSSVASSSVSMGYTRRNYCFAARDEIWRYHTAQGKPNLFSNPKGHSLWLSFPSKYRYQSQCTGTSCAGYAETVIRNYVERHCINPKEVNRKIDNLIQGINNNLGDVINYLSHYNQLSEEIETISKANELGYKIDLDLDNKQYIFEVYQGLDRSINQGVNSKAIFSTEFENISNQKYADSDNNYRNMVLVAGAGEDTNRKTLTLGTENKGLDRYELFVDARDISDTKQQGESEVSIPIEEYNKLLEVRGKEKLSECTKVETFDCTLINVNSLIYRVDFDLGDKVSIINKKWGLMLNERIVSIIETYDEEGLNIDIEIGNNIPTLIEKIKRKMRW